MIRRFGALLYFIALKFLFKIKLTFSPYLTSSLLRLPSLIKSFLPLINPSRPDVAALLRIVVNPPSLSLTAPYIFNFTITNPPLITTLLNSLNYRRKSTSLLQF